VDALLRKVAAGKGRKGEDDSSLDARGDASSQKGGKKVIRIAGDVIMVGDLAHQMSLKAGELISKLIAMGVMATINQAIDVETATIVADEFGFTVEFTGFDELNVLQIEGIDDPEKQQPRPPVVTVMGHVDHGKTSLLDYIRKTSVTAKEHGGITQHIGAYTVETSSHKRVTFLDTPGHAAFTAMRARGAQITDIVILVVAADDGVMPQTIEAINHAKSANVPIIVAVNKMDKPAANPEKVKQQLAEYGLQPEDWGGDTMFVPVSAKAGTGIENLLESVLLLAEVKELKANPECRMKGTVIEVRQEVGRGTVATILVQAGTLKIGDLFVAGAEWGKIRAMNDHTGSRIDVAGPSTPVEITGLSGAPSAGDDFVVVQNENQAKQVATTRTHIRKAKDQLASASGPVSLEEFARQATEAKVSDLNVIVKADVHGSLEAVKESLNKLGNEEVRVKVVHGAVGGINESDVQLAVASKAIILGFGVRGEPRALAEAESAGIELRFYRIIYELIDDIKAALGGLLKPLIKEKNLGRVEVRQTFSAPKIGTIAGCYVVDGTVKRGGRIRLVRDSRVVHEGRMSSLKRFKDDVKEVQSGYECGLSIDGYNDVKVGDVIEVFEIEEVARTL
jgi:translation initiation factor IF-2